jgi:hypothetical protein
LKISTTTRAALPPPSSGTFLTPTTGGVDLGQHSARPTPPAALAARWRPLRNPHYLVRQDDLEWRL